MPRRLVATLAFGLTLAAGVALGTITQQHFAAPAQVQASADTDIPTIPPTASLVVPVSAADLTLTERNLFPAPQSLLTMADVLDLDETQRQRLRQMQYEMDTEVTALGRRVLVEERRLDRAFVENNIEATRVDALAQKIASLQGRIRASRLRNHLAARDVLTPEQLLAFAALRGYDPAPQVSDRGDDLDR